MPLLDYSFKKHRVSLLETGLSGTSWEAWLMLEGDSCLWSSVGITLVTLHDKHI